MKKIKIGILGYGNLGKSIEKNVNYHQDLDLVGIYSKRGPQAVKTPSPAYHVDELLGHKDQIDVLILCGGSKDDIPVTGPSYAPHFNTVDVYDNHSDISRYYDEMDKLARENNKTSIISTGWDPGLFSLFRVLAQAIMPQGQTYTFWGKGLSQGHSDAVRRVQGVKDGVQYTLPADQLISQVKSYQEVDYDQKRAHQREVYLVPEEGADLDQIEETIVNMKDYFEGYETKVHFIDQETLDRDHRDLPHGGHIIRRGSIDEENQAIMELFLDLQSNPSFTGAVALAYARACYRLNAKGHIGANTVVDIPVSLMSPLTRQEIRKSMI